MVSLSNPHSSCMVCWGRQFSIGVAHQQLSGLIFNGNGRWWWKKHMDNEQNMNARIHAFAWIWSIARASYSHIYTRTPSKFPFVVSDYVRFQSIHLCLLTIIFSLFHLCLDTVQPHQLKWNACDYSNNEQRHTHTHIDEPAAAVTLKKAKTQRPKTWTRRRKREIQWWVWESKRT